MPLCGGVGSDLGLKQSLQSQKRRHHAEDMPASHPSPERRRHRAVATLLLDDCRNRVSLTIV